MYFFTQIKAAFGRGLRFFICNLFCNVLIILGIAFLTLIASSLHFVQMFLGFLVPVMHACKSVLSR